MQENFYRRKISNQNNYGFRFGYKFRTRLGYKQYYNFLTKEQLVLARIMSLFEGENMIRL